jgi:hypothetical protein
MLVGTGVAAGALTLPGKWVKPVVDKVLVPAHAQTSCPIECNFTVGMNWDAICNTNLITGDAFVELRVETPNKTIVSPANPLGECIEVKNHASNSSESGGGTIGAINAGQLSKGQYRIYTDIVRITGCVSSITVSLNINACDNPVSANMVTNTLRTISWGTVSVQTDGTSNIRLNF